LPKRALLPAAAALAVIGLITDNTWLVVLGVLALVWPLARGVGARLGWSSERHRDADVLSSRWAIWLVWPLVFLTLCAAGCWALVVGAALGNLRLGGLLGVLPALFFTYCATGVGWIFVSGRKPPGADRVDAFFGWLNAKLG